MSEAGLPGFFSIDGADGATAIYLTTKLVQAREASKTGKIIILPD